MLKLAEIEGDNVDQALAYYKQCRELGTWDAEKAHSLMLLQQNPDELIEAIAKINGAAEPPTRSARDVVAAARGAKR